MRKRVIEINLFGTYHCCLAVARAMVARQQPAALINIGSAAAKRPSRGASAYGAAKGGVVTLTKALAVDCAEQHSRKCDQSGSGGHGNGPRRASI